MYTVRVCASVTIVVYMVMYCVCCQAGVDSGYLEKPCLNPHDEQCPATAPNKNSDQVSKQLQLKKNITFRIFKIQVSLAVWLEELKFLYNFCTV